MEDDERSRSLQHESLKLIILVVLTQLLLKCFLHQVATMNIGLEDTLAYYSPEEFSAGFKKTMAFQPRVIKQNRGSSGEGIWIIKLKDEKLDM